ncbi:hypothetical protein HOG48_02400 [Candidatus Peregrinibacteria bacterium]|nr:hypothetical protein [Candidatus Peregrinibacteria bacterium]
MQRLIQLARKTQWDYKLSQYENKALKDINKSVRKTQSIISKKLGTINPESVFSVERMNTLANEMEALTKGIQAQITNDIARTTEIAGKASYIEHNKIASFNGLIPNFNHVALSSAQMTSLVTKTKVGGKLLNEWVGNNFSKRLQDDFKSKITSGMLMGQSYSDMLKQFNSGVYKQFSGDMESLTRTYVQSVNVNAMHDVARANDDIIKGKKWNSVAENRTCIRCLSLSAKEEIYPIDGGPEMPLHMNCYTGDSQVYAPDAIAATRFNYDGIVYDFESPSGDLFSVTPNHPFLTTSGIISANDINDSIDIIYDGRLDGMFVNKNIQDMPTTFKQIFNSFYISGTPGSSAPISASDFHGDAIFGNGNVDIVYANGFLSDNINSSIFKNVGKRLFAYSNMCDIDFTSLCESFSVFFSVGLATQAVTGGLSVCEAFSNCHAGEPIRSGPGIAPDRHASFPNSTPDSPLTSIKSFSDLVRRESTLVKIANEINIQVGAEIYSVSTIEKFVRNFGSGSFHDALTDNSIRNKFAAKGEHLANFLLHKAGTVKTGNLKFLGKRHFSGHVYDLQCFSTMYYVGGMLSSNCRCFPEYITKTFRELGVDTDEIKDQFRPYTIRGEIEPVTGKILPGKIGVGGGKFISTGRFLGTYEDYFNGVSTAVKTQILGPTRYALWKSGKVSLSELASASGEIKLIKTLTKKGRK